MKFKKGDKVQFIKKNQLLTGEITEINPFMNYSVVVKSRSRIVVFQMKEDKLALVKPLPVIPQFVANYLDDNSNTTLYDVMNPENTDWCEHYSELRRWIQLNSEEYARAWLDGYEIEQEQLYYVKLFDNENGYLNIDKDEDKVLTSDNRETRVFKTKFTEKEIKAIYERFWAFAVPVEEVGDEE